MSLPTTTTRYSSRHKQESRKGTAVKLTDVADTDSVDSNEKMDTSVDNTCYMKLASKLRHLVYMAILVFSGQCNVSPHPIFSTPSIKQIQFPIILDNTAHFAYNFAYSVKLANARLIKLLFDTDVCATKLCETGMAGCKC